MGQSIAIKYGWIAGVSTVAYFLLFYFINPRLLFNPFVYWASLGVYLALIWRALQVEKEQKEGVLDFKQALRSAFLVFVIANLIYYVFYYLLYNWIDPGLVELQEEVMRESLEQAGGMLPEEQKKEMLRSLEEGLKIEPSTVLLTYARSLIGGFLLALGLAAIASRRD